MIGWYLSCAQMNEWQRLRLELRICVD